MPINSNLAPQIAEQVRPQIDIISKNDTISRNRLSDEQKDAISNSLRLFSSDTFDSDTWTISIPTMAQAKQLVFPQNLQETDSQVLRIAVIENLLVNASVNYAKRLIHDSQVVFRFLSDHKLYIENSSTGIIEKFAQYLDRISDNPYQKNNVLRAYEILFHTCVEHGYSAGEQIADFSAHYRTDSKPKRAPDKCASNAITRLLFDLSYPMPLSYRCVLLTLRLIPKRISEVLAMSDDCVHYSDNLFSIGISTKKETNRHIPQNGFYNFQMDGLVEHVYFSAIRLQQERIKKLSIEKPQCRGYLFYDPQKERLISINDINEFLKKLIFDNKIVNSKGKPAKVTSHDFKHITIGERLRSEVFSIVATSVEANHSNINQTLAYGYQSEHDEAMRLALIVRGFLKDQLKTGEKVARFEQESLMPKKYQRVKDQPYARFIPGYGVCTNRGCSPQFEQCVKCEKYTPDSIYIDYFLIAQRELENKIAALQQKRGNPETINYNTQRLDAINMFINRINKSQNLERMEA